MKIPTYNFTIKLLLLLSTILFASSCNPFDQYAKPHLKLSDNRLEISDFEWTYGTVELNQFTGDFEKLDHKVFDLLQGKEGVIKVDLKLNDIDKYGSNNSSLKFIGEINLAELNKYQSWQYWHKDKGLKNMIYEHIVHFASNSDSTLVTKVDVVSKVDSIPQRPLNAVTRSHYNFSFNSLHPGELESDLSVATKINFSGKISTVNFVDGVITVTGDDLTEYTFPFYPFHGSSNTQNNLKLAVKRGNNISGVYVIAGIDSLELVSAIISER